MNKNASPDDDEMPAEFDFSKSIPNPWFVAVHGPEYVRVIDKDLADVFPNNESMNAALRTIAEAGRRAVPQKISAKTVKAPKPSKKKARS
jgi:hypothetical protein